MRDRRCLRYVDDIEHQRTLSDMPRQRARGLSLPMLYVSADDDARAH